MCKALPDILRPQAKKKRSKTFALLRVEKQLQTNTCFPVKAYYTSCLLDRKPQQNGVLEMMTEFHIPLRPKLLWWTCNWKCVSNEQQQQKQVSEWFICWFMSVKCFNINAAQSESVETLFFKSGVANQSIGATIVIVLLQRATRYTWAHVNWPSPLNKNKIKLSRSVTTSFFLIFSSVQIVFSLSHLRQRPSARDSHRVKKHQHESRHERKSRTKPGQGAACGSQATGWPCLLQNLFTLFKWKVQSYKTYICNHELDS